MMRQPTDAEVDRLDPYAFMAVIGKRVIHPGGRRSTRVMPFLGYVALVGTKPTGLKVAGPMEPG